MKPKQTPFRTRESGAVLVFFALILFGLVALLAVSIDTGFVLLARRQMQAAVNSASVEGLRWRDQLPPEADLIAIGEDPSDPELETRKDAIRRAMARHFVQTTFDADFNVGAPEPSSSVLGAGPVIGYEGGVDIGGGLKARSLIREETLSVYKPDPALNVSNTEPGDMVSGRYFSDGAHEEDGAYERDDFVPETDGSAFLVRLRRTDEDFSSAPGSTSGPPIPSIFGRAAIARAEGDDPQALLRRRARGTRVRATSIADLQSALSVGLPVFQTDPSGNPVGMSRTGVLYFVARAVFPNITVNDLAPVPDHLLQPDCASSCCGAIVVGDPMGPGEAPLLPDGNLRVVVAIYDSSAFPGPGIVVGFAHVQIAIVGGAPASVALAGDLVLTNGSGTFARSCQLDAESFDALMGEFRTFVAHAQVQGAAVTVPVRVRAIR